MLSKVLLKACVSTPVIASFHASQLFYISEACLVPLPVQMNYDFFGNNLDLHRPRAFTVCTQHLETGSWVFPQIDTEDWLCIRPITLRAPEN